MKAPFPVFLLLVAILSQVGIVSLVSAQERVYSVGVVPQFEARKLRHIWQPIINYLERETGYQFKIVGSPTIGDFEQELLQGDFDFAYMNPLHLVLANRKIGYRPLVRDRGEALCGVLVVKRGSEIEEVSQLAGKTVSFPAPRALGATLLIKQELEDIYKIEVFSSYAKTHDSVYLNVLLGNAVAGGGVQQTFDRQKKDYQKGLKIIFRTKAVPSHPFAVHPSVPKEVATAVQEAFLRLGETLDGRNILAAIPILEVGVATASEYMPLEQLRLERFYPQ